MFFVRKFSFNIYNKRRGGTRWKVYFPFLSNLMPTYLLHKVFDLGADTQTKQLVGPDQRGWCHHFGILSSQRRRPS